LSVVSSSLLVETTGNRPQTTDQIFFEVSDTGIGITLEQQLHLFRAFNQVDPSTTRRYGGSGLGLVISQRFCQMMGGHITVESELGRGATFRVYLPADVNLASPQEHSQNF
jgi:signal transduction histidine kinase